MLSANAMSKRIPNLPLVWSSTTLGTLKECPRKFQISFLMGFASRGENIDINFGWLYHGALERYQYALHSGADPNQALLTAIRWTMVESADKLLAEASSAGANKSRQNLIRSIVWHCEHYACDVVSQVVIGDTVAVELSFCIEAGVSNSLGESFQFSGHLDRLVNYAGAMYWHDYKTTKATLGPYYFEQFSPDNQASLYTIASRVAFNVPTKGGMIDAAQIAVGFTRFARMPIHRTEAQLDEWMQDTMFWLAQAEVFAKRNYWPMNDKSCFGCSFRSICAKDPRVRDSFLKSNFGTRTYDPLEIRK
jgi:hypothetical protein